MLNYLKLPADVVLTHENETILEEVIVNSTVNASAGLTVAGRVDGVDLRRFIRERITLNTTQAVAAELDFSEDTVLKSNATFYYLSKFFRTFLSQISILQLYPK